jgi:hypothetical protein
MERLRGAKRRLKGCFRNESEPPDVMQVFVEMGVHIANPGIYSSRIGHLLGEFVRRTTANSTQLLDSCFA